MLSRQLNERVTIERRATGNDVYGQPSAGWEAVATVWAGISDLKGRQFVAAQAGQSEVTSEITIRYRDGIEPAMRVVHGSDIYDIIAPLRGDRTIALMCKRGLSNG